MGLKMSAVAEHQTTEIRKGGLATMGGSEIYTRKKEAKKVVRLARRRGSHNQRKRQIFTNGGLCCTTTYVSYSVSFSWCFTFRVI